MKSRFSGSLIAIVFFIFMVIFGCYITPWANESAHSMQVTDTNDHELALTLFLISVVGFVLGLCSWVRHQLFD